MRPDSRDRAIGCRERWPVPNVIEGLKRGVRHTRANARGHVGAWDRVAQAPDEVERHVGLLQSLNGTVALRVDLVALQEIFR